MILRLLLALLLVVQVVPQIAADVGRKWVLVYQGTEVVEGKTVNLFTVGKTVTLFSG